MEKSHMPSQKLNRIMALALAFLVFLADQASKFWILEMVGLQRGDVRVVTDFFNLVLTYNRGVSFGLLYHHHDLMPLALSALALIIVTALLVWLWRQENRLVAVAIGLVVGGAIGNVVDRLRYGGVVDFLDFHAMGYHWPAFNVADSSIVLGVGLLLLDALITGRSSQKAPTGLER